MDISVVIPVMNEEGNVIPLYKEIKQPYITMKVTMI